jgi:hypothetical protein
MCPLSRNSGASTSWNSTGLLTSVAGKLYLYLILVDILPNTPITTQKNNNNKNKRFKEKSGSYIRKIFNTFTTKDYTWNSTHNTESTAV